MKPALADEKSKQGLEAFAKYWYDVFSYAYESGDVKPFDAITDPSCVTCSKARRVISDWHAEGRWIVGGTFDVSATESEFVQTPEGGYQAIAQIIQREITFYRADGTMSNSLPRTRVLGDIMVAKYRDGKWIAMTVERINGAK